MLFAISLVPLVILRVTASLSVAAAASWSENTLWPAIMSKAWSLRYALVRAQLGWEETLTQLTNSTASLPDAIAKGMEVYRKELTKVILFTGTDLLYPAVRLLPCLSSLQ